MYWSGVAIGLCVGIMEDWLESSRSLFGAFNGVLKFLLWLPLLGNEQVKQVCWAHDVCLVQVCRVSCIGDSWASRTLESKVEISVVVSWASRTLESEVERLEGVSWASRTLESEVERLAGIVDSHCPRLSLKN